MPVALTKANQDQMLDAAKTATDSLGWRDDAVAFGAIQGESSDPVAVGVFQSFAGGEAEFHFAMLQGHISPGLMQAYTMLAGHHNGLNLSRVWLHIPAENRRALRVAIGLGFEIEYRKRGGAAGGGDAIVLSTVRDAGRASARA